MGKNKDKKKNKGTKAPKVVEAVSPFAARMTELREILASPLASKSEKKAANAEVDKMRAPAEEPLAIPEAKAVRARHAAHIARVAELAAIVADPDSKKKARKVAEAELAELRAAGEVILHNAAEVDRADDAAVKAYNVEEAALPGGKAFLSSDAEIKARVKGKKAARAAEAEKEAEPVASSAEEWAAARDVDTTPAQVAEEILTEDGREFAVGVPEALKITPPTLFVDPVTGEEFDPEMNVPTNGQGRPLIWDPEKEELVPYSRVTTFIDKLDDKSQISAWKVRNAVAGASLEHLTAVTEGEVSPEGELPSTIIERAATLAADYEEEILKTDKLDRKGKLFDGERGERLRVAKSTYDRAMDALSEEALRIAGTHLKAEHGTYLHYLTAVFDTEGADAVRALDPSPADLADVMAYAAAMKRLGAEVIDVEKRVVIDAHGVTGTLDRSLFYKPAGATRRLRVVGDLKTGRIDYGAGKISMQLAEYATGDAYDPLTHERTKLNLSKSLGLLIHLPAGTATCTIYEVDLTKGLEGIKHAITVGEWRRSVTEAQAYRGKTPFYREILKVIPGDEAAPAAA